MPCTNEINKTIELSFRLKSGLIAGVTAKTIRLSEETIVTETTEEIHTTIPAGDVPSEVKIR